MNDTPHCRTANTPQGLSGPQERPSVQRDQGEDQERQADPAEGAIAAILDASPPLSAAQRARLAILLEC